MKNSLPTLESRKCGRLFLLLLCSQVHPSVPILSLGVFLIPIFHLPFKDRVSANLPERAYLLQYTKEHILWC